MRSVPWVHPRLWCPLLTAPAMLQAQGARDTVMRPRVPLGVGQTFGCAA